MDYETAKDAHRAAQEYERWFRDPDFEPTAYGIVGGSKMILDFLYHIVNCRVFPHWQMKAVFWFLLMMIKKLRHQNYKLATFSVRPAGERDEAHGVYKILTAVTSDLLLHTDDTMLNRVLDETLQEHKRRIVEHTKQLKALQEKNSEQDS